MTHEDASYRIMQNRMIDDQIRARHVDHPDVIRAMASVPRERFVPPSKRSHAYDDAAMAIGEEQTISQPYIVAYMTATLDIKSNHRVMEIGTGSGYQTAILSQMAKHVYTIERLSTLSDRACMVLNQLGMDNITACVGDGSLGWPDEAPFDRIMVTAGAPTIPPPLIAQLADGGILVAPVGAEKSQRIVRLQRRGPTTHESPLLPCRFVKLIGHQGWQNPGA